MTDLTAEDLDMANFATREEAAAILRTTPAHLRELERRGDGPPVLRLSDRKVLYPARPLVLWMKARMAGGVK